ncbi:MAG: thiamine pyrophosphate-binding protein [Burkholderiales bacterium]
MKAEKPSAAWPSAAYQALKQAGVKQVAYVPDAGHSRLIKACHADAEIKAVCLTTEEEGVAMLAGAWLGGERGALLMQSSGAGNCINMLGMIAECRFPLLMILTMRGHWGEFNPWQVPMGQTAPAVLAACGVIVQHVETARDLAPSVEAGAQLAFASNRAVALLIAQRLIGAKKFE